MKVITKVESSLVTKTLGLTSLAYWFWTVFIARLITLTFLFFRDQPKTASLLAALTSVAFAIVLVVVRLVAGWPFRPLPASRAFKWVIFYILWNGTSLIWTFSDTPVSALGYWSMMLLDVVIVIITFKWGEREAVVLASLKGVVTGVYIIDAIALLFAAGDEYGRLGDPDFIHPNTLGHFTALAALISLFLWQREPTSSSGRRIWAVNCTVLCWILIRTLSKTSIIAFTVAALVSIFLGSTFALRRKIRIMFIALLLVGLSYGLMSQYLSRYLEEYSGDVTSLTGRTILWVKTIDMIVERPLVGYGILSFRNYAPQFWDIRIVHGHNEWITQAFQLGIVGVILTAAIYWSYYRHFKRVQDVLMRKLGISILVFILIEGVASAEPVGLLFPLPLLILFILSTGPQVTDGLPKGMAEQAI